MYDTPHRMYSIGFLHRNMTQPICCMYRSMIVDVYGLYSWILCSSCIDHISSMILRHFLSIMLHQQKVTHDTHRYICMILCSGLSLTLIIVHCIMHINEHPCRWYGTKLNKKESMKLYHHHHQGDGWSRVSDRNLENTLTHLGWER